MATPTWTLTSRKYNAPSMTATFVRSVDGMTAEVVITSVADSERAVVVFKSDRKAYAIAEAARCVAMAHDTIGDLAADAERDPRECPLDLTVDHARLGDATVTLIGQGAVVLSSFFEVDLV